MLRFICLVIFFIYGFCLSSGQTFWIEAECADTSFTWQKEFDDFAAEDSMMHAYDPAYITTPSLYANQWLRIGLKIDSAGDYAMHGRIKVLDPASNSLWFRANNGNWMEWEDIGLDTDTLSTLPIPSAIPVIPDAQGFGINTPAGRGGAVYKVTNLHDNGPGSLRACAEANGVRTCVFEIAGFIDLQSGISIQDPFLTIAGQTAPSPGIVLGKGYGVSIETHDVLIQHISILPGDQVGSNVIERDAIRLISIDPTKRINNVVLDHVSMAWSMDENLDLWGYLGDISILNCIIAQNLNLPFDTANTSSYGNLMGSFDQQNRIFISGTYYAGNRDRQPLSRVRNLVMTNNLMYDRVLRFIYLSNRVASGSGGFATQNSILGNVFVEGPSFGYTLPHEKPITFDLNGQLSTSQLYLADNKWSFQSYPMQWQYVKDADSLGPASTPPVPFPNLQYETDSLSIITGVLAQAGSRPADRNPVDQFLIDGFLQGDSLVKECISGCPSATIGWPNLGLHYRQLILPANPNGDVDADGYTNLEEWLHAFSKAVEYGEGTFRWEEVTALSNAGNPVLISLDTGINIIDFAVREAGVKLDKLCISRDGVVPTGLGGLSLPCDSLVLVAPDVLLPLALLDFRVDTDLSKRLAHLSWQLEEDASLESFRVERSSDGNVYQSLASLVPQGAGWQAYQYIDRAPLRGTNYYRLRQTDIAGKLQYSVPIQAVFQENLQVEIYPIPFSASSGKKLQADIWTTKGASLKLQALNALGQIVWQKEIEASESKQIIEIPGDAFSPGFYSLWIRVANQSDLQYITKRIWVQ